MRELAYSLRRAGWEGRPSDVHFAPVPPATPLVALHGIAARIGATTILRAVDLTIAPGQSVGLFGANGAGKTTVLRIVATLLRPSAGTGQVLGADLSGPGRYDVRRRIGLIGHVPGLYPELTLEENLAFAARAAGIAPERVTDVLHAVGLGNAAGRRAGESSHGMQRRVEFARELMLEPDLLLLDEPHTALDPAAVELVAHVVEGVRNRGGAAVIVSHDLDRVAPLVSTTAEIAGGTLR
jgi:heme exporter protein A